MTSATLSAMLWTLFLVSMVGAVPYSKYGRTCKDIGCMRNEVCVMEEEPCTIYKRDNCGRYPTCKKSSESGALSCTTMICPAGQYCKTENGVPTCVSTVPGLAPAARRRPVARTTPKPRPTPPPPPPPPPPPRSSSYPGGRNTGYSGSRNSIGNGSLWNRLFGDTRRGSVEPRPGNAQTYPADNRNYATHTSRDSQGNRVWTFSG